MEYLNIDELLMRVDSDLVSNYEKNNQGLDLAQVNRERIALGESLKPLRRLVKVCSSQYTFWILMAVITIVFLMGSLFRHAKFNTPLLFAAFGITFVVLFVLEAFLTKKLGKQDKILHGYDCILENFISAVAALNPSHRTMRRYDAETVRDEFLFLTVNILAAERELDEVRFQKGRDLSRMLHLSEYLYKMPDKLSILSREARKFGLVFSKKTLFLDAQKHLDKQKQN